MLLSVLLFLTLTLIGCMFHIYFSLGLAMLVGSIVFNYQDSILIAILGFVLSFAAMTVMKLYVGKNIWDGLIDFDIKNLKKS